MNLHLLIHQNETEQIARFRKMTSLVGKTFQLKNMLELIETSSKTNARVRNEMLSQKHNSQKAPIGFWNIKTNQKFKSYFSWFI